MNPSNLLLLIIVVFSIQFGCTKNSNPVESNVTPPIIFASIFGMNDTCSFSFARQTRDGGYIAAGHIQVLNSYSTRIFVVKTDANGNQTWAQTYGDKSFNHFNDLQQTEDGGYILLGATYNDQLNERAILLIKLDLNGNMEWTRTFFVYKYQEGSLICLLPDKGFLIVGARLSISSPTIGLMIQTDSSGKIVQTNPYSLGRLTSQIIIEPASDNGFIIAGQCYSLRATDRYDIYILKIDKNGAQIWTNMIGRTDHDESVSCIRATRDGGCIIAGDYYNIQASFILKTDNSGQCVWSKELNDIPYSRIRSIDQLRDGSFIFTGTTGYPSTLRLIQTDPVGIIAQSVVYGNSQGGYGNSIRETTDGYYLIAGISYENSLKKALLLKVDPHSCNRLVQTKK